MIIFEERDWKLDLIYLESVDSTHSYLKNHLLNNPQTKNICFYTYNQTNGIGSRDNQWIGKKGNLFFSFAIKKADLPKDIPIQSSSIYFSYLLKYCLKQKGSNVWLKWPNDFYIEDKKIGGTITHLSSEWLVCGIGLNLLKINDDYGNLDIQLDPKKCLENYFIFIKEKKSWKDIFSLYKIEFHKSKSFKTTIQGEKKALQNAQLLEDGSIMLNNKKVYSSR